MGNIRVNFPQCKVVRESSHPEVFKYIVCDEQQTSKFFQCLLSSHNVIAVLREKMNIWYFTPQTQYTLLLLSGGGRGGQLKNIKQI